MTQIECCEQISQFCAAQGISDIKYITAIDLLIIKQNNEQYTVDVGNLTYLETNGNIIEIIKDVHILKIVFENKTYELPIDDKYISPEYYGAHKKLRKLTSHRSIIVNTQGTFQFVPPNIAYQGYDSNNTLYFYNSDCEVILFAGLDNIYILANVFVVWQTDDYGITNFSYIENFESFSNGAVKLKGSDNMYYLVYKLKHVICLNSPFLICIESGEIIKIENVKNIINKFTKRENTYFLDNISITYPGRLDEIYKHGFDYIGMFGNYHTRMYCLLTPINIGPITRTKPAAH